MDQNELIKEVYARFGLAYYFGECLHRQLCLIYTLGDYQDSTLITKSRIEEKLKYSFSLTMGQLTKEIINLIPVEYQNELLQALNKRNYLAHHFWFEKVHLMFSSDGNNRLIDELNDYKNCFEQIDHKLTQAFESKFRSLGISDDLVNNLLQDIINGKEYEPLPNKRKLKKKEIIIAVWEFLLPNGQKPLIFQTDDNELWQLCDIGLGWTNYKKIEPEWHNNEVISRYLPAEIEPRPKINKPWSYNFKLSDKAVLWVEKSEKENCFKWGIRI